jgi:uncharacterized damage-inducible protein DinB
MHRMIPYGPTEMANAFRTVRKNTLQIAEEIPEQQYDFIPAPGVRTVSDLLRHMAFAPRFWLDMQREKRVTTLQGYDFGAILGRLSALEQQPKTKAEIVDLLKTEGEMFASWLESLSIDFLAETFTDPMGQNPKTRFENLLSVKEHEMHHRGQLMLIQRMLGITPHLTRQREERARARQAVAQPATAAASA